MEKPQSISRGLKYLWAGVIISIVAGFFSTFDGSHAGLSPSAFVATAITSMVITVLINWFFLHFISKGKNWARIIYLVIFILWALSIFVGSAKMIEIQGLLTYLATVLEFIILLVGIILIFSNSATAWFKQAASTKS